MSTIATILVIDGGGRGSALVDKYLQSPSVSKVLAIPGNDLMLEGAKKPVKIFPGIKTTDIPNIVKICQNYKVDLVDVAQDDAVAAGVVDALGEKGFKVFGPTKAAGQIEWDKAWSREFMEKQKIPSPKFKIFRSEKDGKNFLRSQKNSNWFVKASGLAAGKGALFAKDNNAAIEKIKELKNFGKAGETYLIEECLEGEEFSSFAVVDDDDFILIGHAQDHKTAFNSDEGPNTGGMGCSSKPLLITKNIEGQIKNIFNKTVKGLLKLDRPYKGILYLGGMVDQNGKVWVIEFNARWGDPEAQVIIPSVKNDLIDIVQLTLDGKLKNIILQKDNKYRVVVTAAAKGYPIDYSQVSGKEIFGLKSLMSDKKIKVYGAGIKKEQGRYIAHGGRLFYVVGEGENVADARQKAYNSLSLVYIEGNNLHYRTDIGYRDLNRFYLK